MDYADSTDRGGHAGRIGKNFAHFSGKPQPIA
jgi:hypothetical protein